MKITKSYLKQIIKEELNRLEEEWTAPRTPVSGMHVLKALKNDPQKYKEIIPLVRDEAKYELVPIGGGASQFNLYPAGQQDGSPVNAGKGFIELNDINSAGIKMAK